MDISLEWLYPDFWSLPAWLMMWCMGGYFAYKFLYKASKKYPGVLKTKKTIGLFAFIASFLTGWLYFLGNFNIIVYYLTMTIAPYLSIRKAYYNDPRIKKGDEKD